MSDAPGSVGDLVETGGKAGMTAGAATTCKAAATAYGVPEAAPLCGPIAAVVVEVVWPFVAPLWNLGIGALSGIASAVFGGLMARPIFDPGYDVYEYWQASGILAAWNSAIDGLIAGWHGGLADKGLPDSPFMSTADGASPDERVAAADMLYGILYSMPTTPTAGVCQWAKNCNQFGFPGHMEDVFLVADGSVTSWAQDLRVQWADDPDVHGDANTISYGRPGLVENAQRGGTPWSTGTGPFAVDYSGYPGDCNEACHAMLRDAVMRIWAARLDALKAAIPVAVQRITAQIAHDAYQAQAVAASGGGSTIIARSLIGAAVLGGVGAVTWPYWGSYAIRGSKAALAWGSRFLRRA